jgi:DNA repair exonuclease SbcCD nuclease subunit
MFNLGLLHTSLTGRSGHDTYAPCSEADLRQKGYGYWALGHIHQPEIISRDPWIVFSGNCQGRHAGETGPRGCQLVTVNDDLVVENAEWRDLDVVRWQVLEINLAGVTEESEALGRVAKSMSKAVNDADGRLIAARIIFTGATPLHGSLHRESDRWRAELQGRAQDQGAESIWIEKIKILTSPVYDLAQLAERDALTKIVLETLEEARIESGNLPGDIKDMLGFLPTEICSEVSSDLEESQVAIALEDVRAIILDALGTKGGQVS